MPTQSKPPGFDDIQFLLGQAQSNIGRTIELPFSAGTGSYALTVHCTKPKEEAQWMFYNLSEGASSLDWSIVSNDVNMIHNALCAQFPEVDLNLAVSKGAMAAPTSLLFEALEPSDNKPATTGGAPPAGQAKMEGDLKTLQIANLLQSVGMAKMTGRLEIASEADKAQVYFVDGSIVDCTMQGVSGEDAALELCGWQNGVYRFYHEHPSDNRPINKRLDQILMEGAALLDQQRHLDQQGVTPECYLKRVDNSVTEQTFEQIVARGPHAKLNVQKMLYRAADERSSLLEILRRYPCPRRDWVPALYALLTVQLVAVRQGGPRQEQRQPVHVAPVEIDWSVVRQVERSLYRVETDVLSYPAFLGFMEREQARFEVLGRPYSLVVMKLDWRTQAGALQPLPMRGVKDVARRIERLKRKCDIVAHFQTFGLALLLPETASAQARSFTRSLSELFQSEPIADSTGSLVITFGLAGVPEDCDRLETLLGRAQPLG